jgi:hypothetical protein
LYRGKVDLQEQLRRQLALRVAEDPRISVGAVPAQPTRKIGLRIWLSQALVPSAWAQEALLGPGIEALPGPLRLVLDRSAELFHNNPFGTGAFRGTVLDAIGQLDIPFPLGGGWPDRAATALKAAIEAEKWEEASRVLLWGLLKQLGSIQSLGPRAVRQLRWLAELADPEKDSGELAKVLRYRLIDLPEGEALGAHRRARSAFMALKSAGWPE